MQRMIGLGLVCLLGANVPLRAQELGPFDPKTGLYGGSVKGINARNPDTVSATSSKVWNSLMKIYADYGVSMTIADTVQSVLGAIRVPQRKPVDGKRLSLLLECGSTSFGENADRYAVNLTWLMHLTETSDKKTIVDMRVSGDASPLGLNATVRCESTGKLEDMVAKALRKAAAS